MSRADDLFRAEGCEREAALHEAWAREDREAGRLDRAAHHERKAKEAREVAVVYLAHAAQA